MADFYQKGDCFPELKTANEQLSNKDSWREQAKMKEWVRIKRGLFDCINRLWENDNSWVDVWEDYWFPGIEQFMEDLQAMGYHVYAGSDAYLEGNSQKQRRFCVYLNPIPGKAEWSRGGENETLL